MSPSSKLHGLVLVGLTVIVQSIWRCTLTSDSFNPIEATGSLGASDAGADPDQADPSDPSDDPSEQCSEGIEQDGCNVGVVMPATCDSDMDCESQVCIDGSCAEPTCSDSRENGDETGVDCGGECAACDTSECDDDSDCDSNNCQAGSCRDAACDDDR